MKHIFNFKEINYGSIEIAGESGCKPDRSDVISAIENGGAYFKNTEYEDIVLVGTEGDPKTDKAVNAAETDTHLQEDTELKPCPFCTRLNEVKLRDEYYIKKRDGRTGETVTTYGVSLVHEMYYNDWYCGRTAYNTEPLNYCPVCGIKIEKEIS